MIVEPETDVMVTMAVVALAFAPETPISIPWLAEKLEALVTVMLVAPADAVAVVVVVTLEPDAL